MPYLKMRSARSREPEKTVAGHLTIVDFGRRRTTIG
jgi:hypothetical protein